IIFRNDPFANYYIGVFYKDIKLYNKSLKHLERVTDSFNDYYINLAYVELGMVCYKLEKYEDSIEYYESYQPFEPYHGNLSEEIADSYFALRNYIEALPRYEGVLKIYRRSYDRQATRKAEAISKKIDFIKNELKLDK
ncbi:MAG: tetratricopeptide repeat protein, partial [Cyanobacteriota bacterium]